MSNKYFLTDDDLIFSIQAERLSPEPPPPTPTPSFTPTSTPAPSVPLGEIQSLRTVIIDSAPEYFWEFPSGETVSPSLGTLNDVTIYSIKFVENYDPETDTWVEQYVAEPFSEYGIDGANASMSGLSFAPNDFLPVKGIIDSDDFSITTRILIDSGSINYNLDPHITIISTEQWEIGFWVFYDPVTDIPKIGLGCYKYISGEEHFICDMPTDRWSFLVVNYDSNAQQLNVFLNGKHIWTGENVGAVSHMGPISFLVTDIYQGDYFDGGWVDHLAVYFRNLTTSEIETQYSSSLFSDSILPPWSGRAPDESYEEVDDGSYGNEDFLYADLPAPTPTPTPNMTPLPSPTPNFDSLPASLPREEVYVDFKSVEPDYNGYVVFSTQGDAVFGYDETYDIVDDNTTGGRLIVANNTSLLMNPSANTSGGIGLYNQDDIFPTLDSFTFDYLILLPDVVYVKDTQFIIFNTSRTKLKLIQHNDEWFLNYSDDNDNYDGLININSLLGGKRLFHFAITKQYVDGGDEDIYQFYINGTPLCDPNFVNLSSGVDVIFGMRYLQFLHPNCGIGEFSYVSHALSAEEVYTKALTLSNKFKHNIEPNKILYRHRIGDALPYTDVDNSFPRAYAELNASSGVLLMSNYGVYNYEVPATNGVIRYALLDTENGLINSTDIVSKPIEELVTIDSSKKSIQDPAYVDSIMICDSELSDTNENTLQPILYRFNELKSNIFSIFDGYALNIGDIQYLGNNIYLLALKTQSNGLLYRSDDGGVTWSEVLLVPDYYYHYQKSKILHQKETGITLAIFGDIVYRSTDSGLTWTGGYTLPKDIENVAVSPTAFLVQAHNALYRSTDGITWTTVTVPVNSIYGNILAYHEAAGLFLLINFQYYTSSLIPLISVDGITWENKMEDFNLSVGRLISRMSKITYMGGKFHAALGNEDDFRKIATSTDCVTWNFVDLPVMNELNVTVVNDMMVYPSTLHPDEYFVYASRNLYTARVDDSEWSVLEEFLLMDNMNGCFFTYDDGGNVLIYTPSILKDAITFLFGK